MKRKKQQGINLDIPVSTLLEDAKAQHEGALGFVQQHAAMIKGMFPEVDMKELEGKLKQDVADIDQQITNHNQ